MGAIAHSQNRVHVLPRDIQAVIWRAVDTVERGQQKGVRRESGAGAFAVVALRANAPPVPHEKEKRLGVSAQAFEFVGAPGRSRTGTPVKARDFLTTMAFATSVY